jgi:predicted DNA-binding transcriptional regulator YafY
VKEKRPSHDLLERIPVYLDWLRRDASFNAARAAKHFERSIRTIRRDIEFLRYRYALEIEYDSIRQSYTALTPIPQSLQFPIDQVGLLALYLGEQALQSCALPEQAAWLSDTLKRLRTRLRDQMGGSNRQISAHFPAIKFLRPLDIAGGEWFEKLAGALNLQKKVQLSYEGLTRQMSTRRVVHPYLIFNQPNGWFLLAWCELRSGIRVFRLNRIRELELLPERFTRQAGFEEAQVFQDSFQYWLGEPCPVVLRFAAEVAQAVACMQWHASQQAEFQANGTMILRLRVVPGRDLFRWILSHGADVEVLEPPSLRTQWQEEIARLQDKLGPACPT